jgi:prophage DNA circulation protein
MSWRDDLRPGSFRGVAFRVREHEAEGGRRGELHEFPDRDDPWFEDLGRSARRWSVEAIVIGADYMPARDALAAACEARGPGTLVHPFLGTLTVVCVTFSYKESTAEGGMATFSMEFAEAGTILPAQVQPDTAAAATASADEVIEAAPEVFAAGFSTAGVPAFVETAGVGLIHRLTDAAVMAGTFLGGSGPALRAFEAGLSVLPAGALSMLRAPMELGHAVVGLVGAVGSLGLLPARRIAALRRLSAELALAPAVIGGTPARARQRANQAAFLHLVTAAAAAETVRAVAQLRFPSYDEAARLRDSIADELDVAATALADAGNDAGAEAIEQLRLAMVRDVTARGGSLARLYAYAPAATEPALVTAHRLHGDPGYVIADAAELVERNRVRHPGFVPGGQPLEVRSNG